MLNRLCFLALVLAGSFVSASGQLVDNAKLWNEIGDSGQFFFVKGFVAGMQEGNMAGIALFDELRKRSAHDLDAVFVIRSFQEAFEKHTSVKQRTPEIILTMRHLYSDPANRHIPWESICSLSIQKLRGDDIEPMLRAGRAALDKAAQESAR